MSVSQIVTGSDPRHVADNDEFPNDNGRWAVAATFAGRVPRHVGVGDIAGSSGSYGIKIARQAIDHAQQIARRSDCRLAAANHALAEPQLAAGRRIVSLHPFVTVDDDLPPLA